MNKFSSKHVASKNEVKKHLAKYIWDFPEFKSLGKWLETHNKLPNDNGDKNDYIVICKCGLFLKGSAHPLSVV